MTIEMGVQKQVEVEEFPQRGAQRTGRVWHHLPVLMVAWNAMGLLLAGAVFIMLFENGRTFHHETFALKCMNRAQVVQSELQLQVNIANMYVGLMKSGVNITQEIYRKFSDSTYAVQTDGSAPGWVELIDHSRRAAAEAEIGGPLFTVSYPDSKVQPLSVRELYAYVRFTAESKYDQYKGLNFLEFEPGQVALRDAMASGQARMSAPYYMNKRLAIAAFFPVYRDDYNESVVLGEGWASQRREACMGFLVPSFPVLQIFESSLQRLGDSEDMLVRGYDVSPDVPVVEEPNSALPYPPNMLYAAADDDVWTPLQYDHVVPISLHGRQYELRCKWRRDWVWPVVLNALAWPTVVLAVVVLSAVIIALMVKRIRSAEVEMHAMEQVNSELRAAKLAAEEADRAKSSFICTISHELRTPMTGVIGMTDLLTETELTPTQLDFVQTAQTSGRALLALLTDILDFSKVEAGHMELESVPFNLRNEVDDLLAMFADKARQKGLELAALVHEAVPSVVVGDQVRLRQVLCNLLGNALKFTRQGSVVVTIRPGLPPGEQRDSEGAPPSGPLRKSSSNGSSTTKAPSIGLKNGFQSGASQGPAVHWVPLEELDGPGLRAQGRSGSKLAEQIEQFRKAGLLARQAAEVVNKIWLVIVVEDTGIGIEQSVQPKLFQPFVQANTSTTREFGGTGIGLSISQRIVKLMGGTFWAASSPGVGSTFCFEVPLALDPSKRDPPSLIPSPPTLAGDLHLPQQPLQPSRFKPSAAEAVKQYPLLDATTVAKPDADSAGYSSSEWVCDEAAVKMGAYVVGPNEFFCAGVASFLRPLGFWVECVPPAGALDLLKRLREEGLPRRGGARPLVCMVADWEALGGELGERLGREAGVPSSRSPGASPGCSPLNALIAIARTHEGQEAALEAGYSEALLWPLRSRPLRRAVISKLGLDSCSRRASHTGGANSVLVKRRGKRGGDEGDFGGALAGVRPWLVGKRVLVVDDAPINRKVAGKMLESVGCEVVLASGAPEALELLAYLPTCQSSSGQKPFEIVLMDCQMPEMDGYQATRLIREMEKQQQLLAETKRHRPSLSELPADVSNGRCTLELPSESAHAPGSPERSCSESSSVLSEYSLSEAPVVEDSLCRERSPRRLPIVALTADVIKGTREQCMEAGMDDYCPKPLDKKLLLAVLEKWIGGSNMHHQT